ncbi:dCTP deaminase [Pantoea agglomerans]|jgi:dCTP deaminase|uniref:dCTP deaminase n=1 Tax=Enterobacter agglomerans TaxID=549 RepID=UPI0016543231|nr:dCTP deaminase [Pantoea agglomerans]
MILTGLEIKRRVNDASIHIEPFNDDQITTNTYDLTLGGKLIRYKDEVLDPKKFNAYVEIEIPDAGFEMEKGEFLLGSSAEVIGSNSYVPLIHARSSIARLGLFVHVTADLFDIGAVGQTTFQLYATRKIRLYKGMKIGQVSFWVPKGEIITYTGKYQGSIGPQPSQVHKDFS